MKIADISMINFRAKAWTSPDHIGHARPSKERDVTVSLLAITADNGAVGYHLSSEKIQTPSERFHLPKNATGSHMEKDMAKGSAGIGGGGQSSLIQNKVRPVILGEDPLCRERIFQKLYKMQRSTNNAGLTDSVLSRIDCALWDSAGRMFDQPVYKLLGGHRTKVNCYASSMLGEEYEGGLNTPEAFARYAKECIDSGYNAFKLHTWGDDDWRPEYVVGKPDVKRDAAACAAVREAVGPDVPLMIDCFHYYSRMDALYLGRELEKLNFTWFEEPMEEYNVSSYKWLKEKLSIPIIGPEVMLGKYWTRAEWIINGVCDIARAGVHSSGGITSLMKIVHLCESVGIPLEIHGGGAAALHVMAAMTVPGEYYERGLLHPFLDYEQTPPWLKSQIDPIDKGGFVAVPQLPGLGYDLNWDYIKDNTVK